MLFRIEGTNVKIAAVADALPLGTDAPPGWLTAVFNQADEWVFEADFEEAEPASWLLPPNQSLTVLSFFDQVAAEWSRLQIPGRAAVMKPWAVAEQLVAYRTGLLAPGVQELLLPEARRRSIPVRFLGTWENKVASLDAVSLEGQLDRLAAVAADPAAAAARATARHDAWLAHDLETMDRLLAGEQERSPEFIEHTVTKRNESLLLGLLRVLYGHTQGQGAARILVAVDAIHLCGEASLLALLAKERHTVTRLL